MYNKENTYLTESVSSLLMLRNKCYL